MNIKSKLLSLMTAILLVVTGCGKGGSIRVESADDLGEARVGVLIGSTHASYLKQHYPDAKIFEFESYTDCYLSLDKDRVDALIVDQYTKLDSPKYKDVGTLFKEELSIAFNLADTEMNSRFNRFLSGLKADGSLEKIVDDWMYDPENTEMPEWDSKTYSGKTLKVGIIGVVMPYSFNRDGKIVGLAVDLIERFAHEINRPIEYYDISFAGLIAALTSGKIDVIASGMTITEERKKQMLFPDPFVSSGAQIIVKAEKIDKKAPLTTMDDVHHSNVGVMIGTLHDQWVQEHYPDAGVLRYDTYPDMFLSLDTKKSDVVFVDGVLYETSLKYKGDYEVLGVLFEDPYGVGFSYSQIGLRDQFNQFLREIKANGIYDEIIDKWVNDFDNAKMPEWPDKLTGKPLKLGCSGTSDAFDFILNGKNAGVDIELIERFGRNIGRPIEYYNLNFGGLIAALSSGTVDMISSAMTITEERSRSVAFSDPYFVSQSLAVVLRDRYNGESSGQADKFRSMDDIKDKRIGVLLASIQDQYITRDYPAASLLRMDMTSDLIQALKSKKIDAVVLPHPTVEEIIKTDNTIGILAEFIYISELGIGFKEDSMRDKFNLFLKKIKGNEDYDAMVYRWMVDTDNAVMPEFKVPAGAKKLRIGTTYESPPFSYVKNEKPAGLDMELVLQFAAEEGCGVEISVMNFGGLIPGLVSGRLDIIANSIMITEERAKQVSFSDSYYDTGSHVITLTENLAGVQSEKIESKGWFAKVKESFYDNLVKEKRYMLIVRGLWQTIIITLFSVILGTIIGGIICFMRMSSNALLSGFAKLYISIMRGTPVLVLLMIFFYVVFATSGLNATVVAIFTFALNMGAYSSEMFRTTINGVDKGQKEAGIALGFTKIQTFIFIIAPQAIKQVIPVYKGEVISLLKTTSIVGYVAVVDLTKASDIIRSRTFDAFFPLIVVAVVYFLLAWLLGLALDLLNKKVTSER